MATPLDNPKEGSISGNLLYINGPPVLDRSDPLKPLFKVEVEDDEVPPPPSLTHNQEPIPAEVSSRQGFDSKGPGALKSPLLEGEGHQSFDSWKVMAPNLEQDTWPRAPSFKKKLEDVQPPVSPKPSQEPGDKRVHPGMTSANEAKLFASHPGMEGQHSQAQPQENASIDMQMPAPDSTKVILEVSDVASSDYRFGTKAINAIGKSTLYVEGLSMSSSSIFADGRAFVISFQRFSPWATFT
jgi:hypothetical protein